jgi:hypothetical protein
MNAIHSTFNAEPSDEIPPRDPQNVREQPIGPVHPTLNEIQIRAYRIHHQHGGYVGGYSLDDWLEAEHELDEELHHVTPGKKTTSEKKNKARGISASTFIH